MAIVITVGTPVGKKSNEELRFVLTFSVIPIVASVVLVRQESPVTQKSAAVEINGTNGIAIFEAGLLPPGTYTVHVNAADAGDTGYQLGTDLDLATATTAIDTQYSERIRSTVRANAAVTDLLRQVGDKKAGAHPDVLIDSLVNLDRMAQSPGVIIEPIPGTSDFESFRARSFELRVNVYVVGRANYEAIRNDGDRNRIETLAAAVKNALVANQNLGGWLSRPVNFSTIDTVAFRPPTLSNATILVSLFQVDGFKITRGDV